MNRNAKSLGDFGIEDVKMVQCNGARRNLNLKLSSPHNLRTRAKHESGHLLRSKGSPWHEVDKTEKFYDKYEGFTIKKRAKGDDLDRGRRAGGRHSARARAEATPNRTSTKLNTFSRELEENCQSEKGCDALCNKRNDASNPDVEKTTTCNKQENSIVSAEYIKQDRDPVSQASHGQINGSLKNGCNENAVSSTKNNGCNDSCDLPKDETVGGLNCKLQADNVASSTRKCSEEYDRIKSDVICNGHAGKGEEKVSKPSNEVERSEVKENKAQVFEAGQKGRQGC